MEAIFSQLDLTDRLNDDTSISASALRFSVGDLVIFKAVGINGWYEGEVVKKNQRARVSSHDSASIYIAYVVWRTRDEMSDELELGMGWVLKDTDEFIRPRPEDLTPDPAKFNPLLVGPDDPYYYLYTATERFSSKTDEGTDMEDVFRGMDGIDDAKTNPDGSVRIYANGNKWTSVVGDVPPGLIYGVNSCDAFMFSVNYLSARERSTTPMITDFFELFKQQMHTGMSLAELEVAAKSCNGKKLQLADCLMMGLHGWPIDSVRACNLYCAAAWGCTEEEEQSVHGIPVGDPKAMIAVASLAIRHLSSLLGYAPHEQCPYQEWIGEGLRSAENMDYLFDAFTWLTNA